MSQVHLPASLVPAVGDQLTAQARVARQTGESLTEPVQHLLRPLQDDSAIVGPRQQHVAWTKIQSVPNPGGDDNPPLSPYVYFESC